MDRKQIGVVGVDAGVLMVGDPCYFWPNGDQKSAAVESLETWGEVCALMQGGPGKDSGIQLNFARGHAGLGVIVETTCGDGCFPVYLETGHRGENGRGSSRRLVIELD